MASTIGRAGKHLFLKSPNVKKVSAIGRRDFNASDDEDSGEESDENNHGLYAAAGSQRTLQQQMASSSASHKSSAALMGSGATILTPGGGVRTTGRGGAGSGGAGFDFASSASDSSLDIAGGTNAQSFSRPSSANSTNNNSGSNKYSAAARSKVSGKAKKALSIDIDETSEGTVSAQPTMESRSNPKSTRTTKTAKDSPGSEEELRKKWEMENLHSKHEKEDLEAELELLKMQNKMLTTKIEKTQIESLSQLEKEREQRAKAVAALEEEKLLLHKKLLDSQADLERRMAEERENLIQALKRMEKEKEDLATKVQETEEMVRADQGLLNMQKAEYLSKMKDLEEEREDLASKVRENEIKAREAGAAAAAELERERVELQAVLSKVETEKTQLVSTLRSTEAQAREQAERLARQLEEERALLGERLAAMEKEKRALTEQVSATEQLAREQAKEVEEKLMREKQDAVAAMAQLEREKKELHDRIVSNEHKAKEAHEAQLLEAAANKLAEQQKMEEALAQQANNREKAMQDASNAASVSVAEQEARMHREREEHLQRQKAAEAAEAALSRERAELDERMRAMAQDRKEMEERLQQAERAAKKREQDMMEQMAREKDELMKTVLKMKKDMLAEREAKRAAALAAGMSTSQGGGVGGGNHNHSGSTLTGMSFRSNNSENSAACDSRLRLRSNRSLFEIMGDSGSAIAMQTPKNSQFYDIITSGGSVAGGLGSGSNSARGGNSGGYSMHLMHLNKPGGGISSAGGAPHAPPNTGSLSGLAAGTTGGLFHPVEKIVEGDKENENFMDLSSDEEEDDDDGNDGGSKAAASRLRKANNAANKTKASAGSSTGQRGTGSSSAAVGVGRGPLDEEKLKADLGLTPLNTAALSLSLAEGTETAGAALSGRDGGADGSRKARRCSKRTARDGDSGGKRGSDGAGDLSPASEAEDVPDEDDDEEEEEEVKNINSVDALDEEFFADLPAPHAAAALGDMTRLRLLEDLDMSLLNSLDNGSRRPLFYAAAYGREEAVKYLLSLFPGSGMDGDMHGDTALHAATAAGHAQVAEIIILDSGEISDPHNNMQMTPAHLASSPECLEVLFKYGSDMAAMDGNQRSPLFIACAMNRDLSAEFLVGCLDQVEGQLLQKDTRGDTPLHAAACNGSVDCLLLLLQYGIDPRAVNGQGLKAIDLAVRNNHKKCRDILAEYHLHFCTSSEFDSVLFLATLEGHKMVTQETRSEQLLIQPDDSYSIIRKSSSMSMNMNTNMNLGPAHADAGIQLSGVPTPTHQAGSTTGAGAAGRTGGVGKGGGGGGGLHKVQSMFSMQANHSLRLQRWGRWLAYVDDITQRVYWYNHEESCGQWEEPLEVAMLQQQHLRSAQAQARSGSSGGIAFNDDNSETSARRNAGFDRTLHKKMSMRLKRINQEWIQYVAESGKTFYYNDKNGNFQWEHPLEPAKTQTPRLLSSGKQQHQQQQQQQQEQTDSLAQHKKGKGDDRTETDNVSPRCQRPPRAGGSAKRHPQQGGGTPAGDDSEQALEEPQPMPPMDPNHEWKPFVDPDTGAVFWFNHVTNISQWDCPFIDNPPDRDDDASLHGSSNSSSATPTAADSRQRSAGARKAEKSGKVSSSTNASTKSNSANGNFGIDNISSNSSNSGGGRRNGRGSGGRGDRDSRAGRSTAERYSRSSFGSDDNHSEVIVHVHHNDDLGI